MRRAAITIRSSQRPGRLIPAPARGLKSRAVTLRPGQVMDWHSTQQREELILVLAGTLELQLRRPSACRRIRAGQSAFLPAQTLHRLVNHARLTARYVYITGPTTHQP